MLNTIREKLSQAGTIDAVISVYDQFISLPFNVSPVAFGVSQGKMGIEKAKKLRREANEKALSILNRVGDDASQLTEEDKAILRQYTGLGGIGETTNEYYTPQFVAEGMWEGMSAMGLTGGNALEPSAGVGVFSGTKPPAIEMTAAELDYTSGSINALLHPEDTVHLGNFEKLAAVSPDESFDHVIGNPPFGDRGEFGKDDPEFSHIKVADKYFVERSIRLCRAGGLIALALPPRIIDRKSWADWRKQLSYQAEFLGAHLLPAGTFNANGTGTTVAVAFWRKHGKDVTAQLENTPEETLINANVLWESYINGTYWDKDGRKYAMGDLEYKKGQFDSLETTVKGEIDPSAIRTKLARPFKSRIDWDLIGASEPVSEKYTDGDTRMINGRLKKLVDNHWMEADTEGQNGESLDASRYGVETVAELRELLDNPYGLLHITAEQANLALKNFPAFFSQKNRKIIKLVQRQKPKHQDQVMRGGVIGAMLDTLRSGFNRDTALRDEVINLSRAEFEMFGHPHRQKALVGLSGEGASWWNSFAGILDKDGSPSAAMTGEVVSHQAGEYDDTNPESVIRHLWQYIGNREITLEDFNEFYTGKPLTVSDLIKDDSIAYTAEGFLAPMDAYCSGDAVIRTSQLMKAIGKAARAPKKHAAELDKWHSQVEKIKAKRSWQGMEQINVTLNAPWIDKSLIIEFLQDNGYTEFKRGNRPKEVTDSKAGEFWGYRYDENGKKLSRQGEEFHRHLENYLNGQAVSGEKTSKAVTMKEIHALDAEFSEWLQAHDMVDDVERQYNDRFNRYIMAAEDKTDLELQSVSGNIKLMGYQNAAIRRLAEDGRGLLGFQMGLGKTFTALGLAGYLYETGRSKRAAIVVPKSTYENWYHENIEFYGHGNQSGILFVGLEPERDGAGEILQTEVLDQQGKPTGKMRDVVRELNSKEITQRMNMIPHSNYRLVVMTKEQFARIPMRPETKETYVDKMVANQNLRSTKLALETVAGGSLDIKLDRKSDYQRAKKLSGFRQKYSDEGTQKEGSYPFFEDMLFDSVIADEAHNYRNSYQAGREASKLAWLPTTASAKSSLDMSLKLDHVRSMNGGKGAYPMTATPTVNSPTDIFNILSLVIGVDEWQDKYGIGNVDDFIRVFGDIDTRDIERLSGEIEPQEALVGFTNLRGLRNLFHRWVNLKSADDVEAEVEIPDLDEQHVETPMNAEQREIYMELRAQAEWWRNATEEERAESDITVFGTIRKMDKISTDIDLYNGEITYLFDSTDEDKVRALVDKLPKSLKVSTQDGDKEGDLADDEKADTQAIEHNARITLVDDKVSLVVNAPYESKVNDLLSKVKIDEDTVTHPVTPKYAALIENVVNGLKDGKQIIFTEEKTQHEKLRRLLAHHTGLKRSQIGIINADTVVKGKFPPDADAAQAGLEAIAADYNEGRTRIIIANKKAEVGINLHRGTTDIHHLTIPWTPASLKQRNGRGARVGSTQKSVRTWIYESSGSFDKFRYETMKRKQDWIDDVLLHDNDSVRNANADDMEFAGDLLATSETERQRMRLERQAEAERKQREEMQRRASRQLATYLQNGQIASSDEESIRSSIAAQDYIIEENSKTMSRTGSMTKDYKAAAVTVRGAKDAKRRLERQLRALPGAKSKLKQLRSQLRRHIENGLLSIDLDVLDTPENYVSTPNGKAIKVGSKWKVIANARHKKNSGERFNIMEREAKDEMIVQVVRHKASLGFAECNVLWPESVYIGGSIGREGLHSRRDDIPVFYDNFMFETDYDASQIMESNIIHTIKARHDEWGQKGQIKTGELGDDGYAKYQTVAKVDLKEAILMAETIGRERLREILTEQGGMIWAAQRNTYGGSTNQDSGALFYKDGEVIYLPDSDRNLTMEPFYILPSDMTEELKKKVGVWALGALKEGDALDNEYGAKRYVPESQMRSLMGAQWFTNIATWGNAAPLELLADKAGEAIKTVMAETGEIDQLISDHLASSRKAPNSWRSHDAVAAMNVLAALKEKFDGLYRQLLGQDYDNVREIKNALSTAIHGAGVEEKLKSLAKTEYDRQLAEEAAAQEAENDFYRQTYNEWLEGATEDEASQRLSAAAQFANAPMVGAFASQVVDIYQADRAHVNWLKVIMLRFNADLSHFTKRFRPIDMENIVTAHIKAENQWSEWRRMVNNGENPLEIDQPVETTATETANGEIVIAEGALSTMRLHRNTQKLELTKSWGRGRGRKTKVIGHAEPGTVIGIQDPEGRGGKLAALLAGNKEAKAKYGASWHNTDEGPELTGGWWLISGSTDLAEFNTELENA